MKSSPGFRVIVAVASLCALPFQACTNDDLDFTPFAGAGGDTTPRAGGAGAAGKAAAGFAGDLADAGTGGVSGDAGEAGAAGTNGGSGAGGMPSAGGDQGGNAGQGGLSGGAGSSAGRGGAGGSAGRGGAGGSAGRGGGGAGGSAGRGGASGGGGTAGALPVCGNALLESDEQCDDGNSKNLDACNNSCAFEQSQRANSIELRFQTGSLCPSNAFGAAFEGSAQDRLQAIVNRRVADGSLSLLLAFRELNDLSGTSSATISLGVTYGAPSLAPNYDGKNDLDWWYTPAAGQVNMGELPSNSAASFSAGVMNANPGRILLPLLSEVPLSLSSTKLRLYVGASSEPLASSGVAPGHLPSEHLRPGLVSFASAGGPPPGNGDPGQLCGNISAASLSEVAIPAAYASGGTSPCVEGYAATRSFLDLLVGGCELASGAEVVLSTQPDQADPDAPQAGAGAPYRLISNPMSRAVTGCRDENNSPVTLATCLKAAAYSSAYRLKTGRVIIK